jgi:hypothetical protein
MRRWRASKRVFSQFANFANFANFGYIGYFGSYCSAYSPALVSDSSMTPFGST